MVVVVVAVVVSNDCRFLLKQRVNAQFYTFMEIWPKKCTRIDNRMPDDL